MRLREADREGFSDRVTPEQKKKSKVSGQMYGRRASRQSV